MRRIVQILDRFWFAKAPAARLALLRILIGSYALFYLGRRYRMLMRISQSDPSLFKPVGVATVLDKPLPVGTFRLLLLAMLLANVAFVLGWRYRFFGPLYASLLLWVLCYRNSWSMIYHSDNALVLHVLTLGLARASDAHSLDTFRRPPKMSPTPLTDDWRYGWPIQLMNTVTTLTYFLSGVAKLAGPLGWQWATGEALRSQIAVDGLRKELLGDGAAPLAFRLYNQVFLYRLLALGSLIIEVAAPVFLVNKHLARLWALGAFGMHWGIFFIMKIKFRYQLSGIMYASFFDVEKLAKSYQIRLI